MNDGADHPTFGKTGVTTPSHARATRKKKAKMLLLVLALVGLSVAEDQCEPNNKFKNCNKKERDYVRKYKGLSAEVQAKELARLRGLAGKSG